MNEEEAPSVPAPHGIICPRCRGTVWEVYQTRRYPGRLVRVRTCKGCHMRVRTREVVEAVIGDGPAESRSGSGHAPSIV